MNTLIPLFSAIVTGAVGLIAGIAIPILLDPTTVQGPLLGILGTGPLGVVLGGHAGVVWAARRRGRVSATDFFWLGLFAAVTLLMNEWFVAVLSARSTASTAYSRRWVIRLDGSSWSCWRRVAGGRRRRWRPSCR